MQNLEADMMGDGVGAGVGDGVEVGVGDGETMGVVSEQVLIPVFWRCWYGCWFKCSN
jgi:hypothetical protein